MGAFFGRPGEIFRITDSPSEQETEAIFQELCRYNLARLEDTAPKGLGVYYEDADGKMIAGLIGETHGNWLAVEYLWVEEKLRGQGIGGELLKKAEEEARKRGSRFAFVNTFDFQAPWLYTRFGYKEVFVLEDYPLTGKRRYYTKKL